MLSRFGDLTQLVFDFLLWFAEAGPRQLMGYSLGCQELECCRDGDTSCSDHKL